ncbi:MAG TPA: ABC transporter permease, partial [Terriglobales bacterium]|nr:ABC transporter permease [Terriglobales bacterium]
ARPDFKVWFFILGLCLITGVLFGTAPALRSLRIELISNLKGIAPSAKSRGLRLNFGKSFVVLQVAVSMILLVSAGLLTRSLVELENQQLGFEPRNVLIAKMGARLGGYRSEQLPGLLRHALERVRALPGVERATVAVYSPISGNQNDTSISIPGYVPQPNERMNIQRNWVGPDYFQTLGIAIKEGRGIGREDLEGAPRVAVVSENVVHRFFSREDPIGHKFYAGSATAPGDEIEIIGVVEDTKFDSLRGQASPMVFFPAFQKAGESFPWADELEVRISGSPESAAAELRQAIRSIDPNLPLQKINLLDQQITDSLQRERTTAKLANHFATLALLLACVGILGLVTHTVIHRTNEIGLRMAVGAGSQQVLWMIMRECLVMITTGLVLGIVAAIISARLLQHQLFAVQSADPMTMLFASALLFLTAMLASYIPARRATKIDPMVALRYE